MGYRNAKLAGTATLLLFFSLLNFNAVADSPVVWARSLGTREGEGATGVAVDSKDNVYVIGRTGGSLDGTPKERYPFNDMVIAKYNLAGDLQWLRQVGDEGVYDVAIAVAVDSEDNVYVVGGTFSDLDVKADRDVFILKYDSDGKVKWKQYFDMPEKDFVADVALDAKDNLYIVGSIYGDPHYGFIAKYSKNGKKKWLRQHSMSPASLSFAGVEVDERGDIYVVGRVDVSPASGSGSDLFLAKFDSKGKKIWMKQLGKKGENGDRFSARGKDLAIDSHNNVFVLGESSYRFGSAPVWEQYALLVKYDADGNQQWLREDNRLVRDFDDAVAICIDGNDNVYEQFEKTGINAVNAYDSKGERLWSYTNEANLGEYTEDYANGIAVDSSNQHIYMVGTIRTADDKTGYDMYVVKLRNASASGF